VPVTAKIRVLPTEAATLELVQRIEATGVSMLTVHGRTKEQNKIHVGGADWAIIRKIKAAVSIPVIANGGVETYDDYMQCLAETGADAVMSSEGLLENPSVFSGPDSTLLLNGEWTAGKGGRFASREEEAFALAQRQLRFAEEYLALAAQFWPREGVAAVKGHLFKFLYQLLELPQNHDLRERLGEKGNGLAEYAGVVAELKETRYASLDVALRVSGGLVLAPTSWYRRHRLGATRHMKTDALLERPMEERLLSLKERLLEKRRAKAEAAEEEAAAALEALV
jgi:tRNA-dihydrouridine synthase 1